jgi:UPF0042 nucleotide-binding protein
MNHMELVLITGMSGSGKSVALHALEDAGYYCVDNLPPELLLDLVTLEKRVAAKRLAVAMDVRSAMSLPLVPQLLKQLRDDGIDVKPMFLDASTGVLVRRFSETRRKHPLSDMDSAMSDAMRQAEPRTQEDTSQHTWADIPNRRALVHAIELERELLGALREQSHVIDTSLIRSAQLQARIKDMVSATGNQLTLVFESFAFKRGIPGDADYVFDVRMLPNPHYEPALKELTGLDAPVAEFLKAQADVLRMKEHIQGFLNQWLTMLTENHRSYVTVAIGCTGGQHRSVYLVEALAAEFAGKWRTLKLHREINKD